MSRQAQKTRSRHEREEGEKPVLELTEIRQDSGAAYEFDGIIDSMNVEIKRKCFQPYWDEEVCHVTVEPTGEPAYVVFRMYREVEGVKGKEVPYDDYILYYYSGGKWHKTVMHGEYSWEG